MLTQKTMGFESEATVLMDCRNLTAGTFAGLLCIGRDYRGIGVCTDGIYLEENGQRSVVVGKRPAKVYLSIHLDITANQHQFAYSLDGRQYTPVGTPFKMSSGNWKGIRVGLYCYGNGGKALFDDFKYQVLK